APGRGRRDRHAVRGADDDRLGALRQPRRPLGLRAGLAGAGAESARRAALGALDLPAGAAAHGPRVVAAGPARAFPDAPRGAAPSAARLIGRRVETPRTRRKPKGYRAA